MLLLLLIVLAYLLHDAPCIASSTTSATVVRSRRETFDLLPCLYREAIEIAIPLGGNSYSTIKLNISNPTNTLCNTPFRDVDLYIKGLILHVKSLIFVILVIVKASSG